MAHGTTVFISVAFHIMEYGSMCSETSRSSSPVKALRQSQIRDIDTDG